MPVAISAVMDYLQFILSLVVIYFLSFAIMHRLGHVNRRSYTLFRLVLLPGIIIHELSHAVACMLTGTPIVEISFWDEAGGHVRHHKPKYSFIVQPIISLAPFIVGTSAVLLLSRLILESAWYVAALFLFLMVSVAATLAPSATDLRHAAEGGLILLIIAAVTFGYFPQLAVSATPFIEQLNQQLLLALGVLAAIWASMTLLHVGMQRR